MTAPSDESKVGEPIRVVVAGPNGKMGRVMMDGLACQPGIEVTGGLTRADAASPETILAGADVLVDFTNVDSAHDLLLTAIAAGVRPVSGTSGLSEQTLAAVDEAARAVGIGAVWAANFGLAAALMMQFAVTAAEHMDSVEIVEAHLPSKADAPSGTALELARSLRAARGRDFDDPFVAKQTLPGTRGGAEGGVRVHSLRLSGLIGWHEVVFAGGGEILTIRHETNGRERYVPAVARAIHEVVRSEVVGLIRGYDTVIGLTPSQV